ncbi:hypothetical protein EX30DRAFT_234603 [Ascodesmis nigricans]|uniref:Uncharacterized protein n=1 Tax=Ascodesmis nigricans TaxID=341454 RepID=A0A4S2MYX5_9PEZI|nr:hypothetical protein EX30DRAFT_234603 [Ascodesmis nigricans]
MIKFQDVVESLAVSTDFIHLQATREGLLYVEESRQKTVAERQIVRRTRNSHVPHLFRQYLRDQCSKRSNEYQGHCRPVTESFPRTCKRLHVPAVLMIWYFAFFAIVCLTSWFYRELFTHQSRLQTIK